MRRRNEPGGAACLRLDIVTRTSPCRHTLELDFPGESNLPASDKPARDRGPAPLYEGVESTRCDVRENPDPGPADRRLGQVQGSPHEPLVGGHPVLHAGGRGSGSLGAGRVATASRRGCWTGRSRPCPGRGSGTATRAAESRLRQPVRLRPKLGVEEPAEWRYERIRPICDDEGGSGLFH